MKQQRYVLITAARNEEAYIAKTLNSVVNQTVLPEKWVIISDGSTDRTDEIVTQYAKKHDFIQLIRADSDAQRNFGSKVKAVNYGYQIVKKETFAFVGNLDADISLNPLYYEYILKKFAANDALGVAGGHRYDNYKGRFIKVNCALNSVGGPYQLFRRDCFEKIGGFIPLEYGAEDAAAEISARMYGWQVKSFPEIMSYHHRCTGGATRNVFKSLFRNGYRLYVIGYHPLFYTLSAIRKVTGKPYLGSLVELAGFYWAGARRFQRPVSDKFINYLRSEQMTRMTAYLRSRKDPAMAGE